MRVLVVGGGGREHALAWKTAQSPLVEQVYVAPGNAGTALENKVSNVSISAEDIDALLAFAQQNNINLTIVGPEAPLVTGIVDQFEAAGQRIFGPCAQAAQLEGSKAFSKMFLLRHGIPTADYREFTDSREAHDYLNTLDTPLVIKADGLAAGKGVIIARTHQQAHDAVRDMLQDNAFGSAGHRVIIESFLYGEEASFICMVDGEHAVAMASSQDHKARDEGDTGPNTGGMGAYSPAPVVDESIHQQIMDRIIKPTVAGMRADGHPFRGFLYAGVMIGDDKVARVLEFNVRLGDPETQAIMMRLDSDLVALCLAACDGKLHEATILWDPRTTVGVVMAAEGYPESYAKGRVIHGLDDVDASLCKVFHAGTRQDIDAIVTAGGRVLCVVGRGDSVRDAQKAAYSGTDSIAWQGVYYRKDIAHRALTCG